jgi:hypothetical protein
MQDGKEPGQDHPQQDKLVDDDAFVRLMEDAWNKEGKPVDQLAKSRVWSRLEHGDVKAGSRVRFKWQLPALLVAGLAGIVFATKSFWLPSGDDGQQIKGVAGAVAVSIGFYLQEKEGELLPWNPSQRRPGEVIVPFVVVKNTAAVTLLRKTAGDTYEMVSDAQWAKAGFEHYFASGDDSTAIELEPIPETYCVLAVPDLLLMGKIIQSLPALDLADRPVTLECFAL